MESTGHSLNRLHLHAAVPEHFAVAFHGLTFTYQRAASAMQGAVRPIGSNLGFRVSVLPKDTMTDSCLTQT